MTLTSSWLLREIPDIDINVGKSGTLIQKHVRQGQLSYVKALIEVILTQSAFIHLKCRPVAAT